MNTTNSTEKKQRSETKLTNLCCRMRELNVPACVLYCHSDHRHSPESLGHAPSITITVCSLLCVCVCVWVCARVRGCMW